MAEQLKRCSSGMKRRMASASELLPAADGLNDQAKWFIEQAAGSGQVADQLAGAFTDDAASFKVIQDALEQVFIAEQLQCSGLFFVG